MLVCSKCGKAASEGSFCPVCGGRLIEAPSDRNEQKLKSSMGKRRSSSPSIGKSAESEVGTSRFKGSLGTNSSSVKRSGSLKRKAGYTQFKRSPRIRKELPNGTIEIAPPPTIGSKPEINWLATFLPTIVTIGIAIVMTTVLGSPMMMIYTLPMTIAGVIVSITNYRKQTKTYNQQNELRRQRYNDHINNMVDLIEARRQEQLAAMLLSDPDTKECISIAKNQKARLWERRPEDPDFLSARLGGGEIKLSTTISIPKESISLEDDVLKSLPKQIKEKYETIENAPIVCDIYRKQVLGVVGSHEDAKLLIKNMVVQLSTHHCYTELKIVFILSSSDTDLTWVKALPHALDSERISSYVAMTKEDAKLMFKSFFEGFKQRQLADSAEDTYGATSVTMHLPYYLFVILEPGFLDKADPINEFLFRRRNLGVGCIMAVQSIAQLPKECLDLVEIKGTRGELFNAINASEKQEFQIDELFQKDYDEFGASISKIYCDEEVSKDSIPTNYTFFEMLHINSIREYNLERHWTNEDTQYSLAAPVGINEAGKIISLDLHEKGHGPHGLIAGATRSGKSEFLQTYILSMAMKYHPYEVGFLLIDFKGGGLSNQFAHLPHLLGSITNISTDEINRSLSSIKAELVKRQHLFANCGVNTIEKYHEKYKSHLADTPLPHLIIIVDEFAELKAEQPEFMKELVSTARIGGSLGVHLILATQKPAGQVNEQIWSNSRFQICLRVASESDSNEVIKSPLAANITNPGRAYLRVGNNEIFELFQSAYSGGTTNVGESVFDACIERIQSLFTEKGLQKLPDICLPSLDSNIPYPQLLPEGHLPLGIYDDPANQFQGEFQIDYSDKNCFIVGASLSGKTNILQCVIRGIADRFTPKEVNLYIIDFASGVLKVFEALNHVGGVVTPLEDEKLKNLFKLIDFEIDNRRKKFMELGVGSFSAYREAGLKDLPQIVILVDNLSSLKDLYFQEEDPLLTICQNGLTYGISVIVANNQSAGLGYKYLPSFSSRVALYCNDTSEYSSLFDRCSLRIPDTPGRCIVEVGKKLCTCQAYQAFPGDKEIDRAVNIRSYIEKINARNLSSARKIPVIPDVLSEKAVLSYTAEYKQKPGQIAIGIDYQNVKPVIIDFRSLGVLQLVSSEALQTTKLMRFVIKAFEAKESGDIEFYIVDNLSRSLEDCRSGPLTKSYVSFPEKGVEIIHNVEEQLAKRYQRLLSGEETDNDKAVITLVLNGVDAIDTISSNVDAMTSFKNILGKYKNLGVCVILCEGDNAPTTYNSPEILKKVKDERKLICFDDLPNIKIVDIPFSAQRVYRKPNKLGDCYFISGGDLQKIKVALSERN